MASNQEFRVQLYPNGANASPVAIYISRAMPMARFKKLAGRKLGIKARRVFTASGSEIVHVDEIGVDDVLYISQGEPFFNATQPAAGSNGQQETMNVSVLGTGGVGKSAITLRFVRDFFVRDWDPTIEDAYRKVVDVDGKLCMLEILDTAGQDDFESLRPQWMMDKDGYVFVFSLESPKSLEDLKPFMDLHRQINSKRNVPVVFVGNKSDIIQSNPSRRRVSRQQAMGLANQIGAHYIETSALSGLNVQEVFEGLVKQVRMRKEPTKPPPGLMDQCCTLM